MDILSRRDSLYFQVVPWHFCFIRGHSLLELTEIDNNSAADIIVPRYIVLYVHICTAAFIVHNVYRSIMNGRRRRTPEESCK